MALVFYGFTLLVAEASDDYLRAASLQPTLMVPCAAGTDAAKTRGCTTGLLDRLAAKVELRLQAVLARADATTGPLIKRDQVRFNEIVGEFANASWTSDDAEGADRLAPLLTARVATLDAITPGIGPGMVGRWENAFGYVAVTPGKNGALRFRIETKSSYGPYSDHRFSCRAEGMVVPGAGDWLRGQATSSAKHNEADDAASGRLGVRMRRQGATLRVVAGDESTGKGVQPDCNNANQITATYFFVGRSVHRGKASSGSPANTPSDKGGGITPAMVFPSFDCARPATASEEEICADPELASNDIRLNRAWGRLLPRLDAGTRTTLQEDQSGYVRAQSRQYVQFLNPAWNKQYSYVHHTAFARDKLAQLQRERIALLEGFDMNRKGLEGLWLSHTAILRVTNAGGKLKAEGWKWDQGDWKAGCDYAMEGTIEGARFVSDEKRANPDTLERESASLVVNRRDDEFSAKRGRSEAGLDEPKCKRNTSISSTARLFPALPSPDIDSTAGEIR